MKVCKIFEWSYGHNLTLDYFSNCTNFHGHSGKVEVELEGPVNKNGMVMDFSELKKKVNEISFDHQYLNEINCPNCNKVLNKGVMEENPTAENIVTLLKNLLDNIDLPKDVRISRIRVWETPTSYAEEEWELLIKNKNLNSQ